MEAIEFIAKYQSYLDTIKLVIKPKYYPALKKLEVIDPHDLVSPNSWFPDENSAMGLVYRLIMKEVKVL